MKDFIFHLRKKHPNVYQAKQNSEVIIPGITLQNIPGIISISKYNGVRQANFTAMFNSYSTDREEAYNELLSLQESLIDTNREFFKSAGYETVITNITDIQDLTFIESSRNLYRFNFQINVNYERKVI